ncbi:MAG: Lrp/AsnC family transcriptional regulator, partial [Spirochaetes bacterium]
MYKLDNTNREILSILQNDGSITNADLARKVGLAPASTLERVRK